MSKNVQTVERFRKGMTILKSIRKESIVLKKCYIAYIPYQMLNCTRKNIQCTDRSQTNMFCWQQAIKVTLDFNKNSCMQKLKHIVLSCPFAKMAKQLLVHLCFFCSVCSSLQVYLSKSQSMAYIAFWALYTCIHYLRTVHPMRYLTAHNCR